VPDAKFEIVDFRAAMQGQPADRLVAPRTITEHSVSSYFCTGGTTGAPKIAVRTHGNEIFDAWAAAQVLGEREEPRTYFCGLPLFHVNAQLATGLLPWMHGHHVLLATPEGYRGKNLIARFWEIAAHYRIAAFSGVPTIYAALLEAPIGDNDISSLEYAICGAAPMPAKLIEAFEVKTGLKIVEGYGLTEGTCVSCLNPTEGKRRAGSIGLRLPYQQMRAVILDDAGHFLRMADVDEVGTIAITGPNVFAGYLDPQQNADLWIDIEGTRWLNTGDLGRQDGLGYFWLAGRRKELIIRGGHNIDPKLIEDALSKHPAVAMAAAVGSPDAYAGEVPVAYVQPKPGVTVTDQELRTHTVYDLDGNVQSVTDPRQVTTSYAFDRRNRLTATYEDWRLQVAAGRLEVRYDRLTTLAYDATGNLEYQTTGQSQQADNFPSTTHYVYDALNRQVQVTEALGTAEERTTLTSYDDAGNPITSNLAEYAMPSAAELPSFEVSNTQTDSPRNPLGAKGIGESGTIGSTPAVVNAVLDALTHLGVSHLDMPVTPRRVWEAISAAS
jgi:YD repeat-containing protein